MKTTQVVKHKISTSVTVRRNVLEIILFRYVLIFLAI